MLNLRSLVAVAAITTLAMMSVVQAEGQPGRKIVHQPELVASETRGSRIPKIDDTRFHHLTAGTLNPVLAVLKFWQSTPRS
jgi:hypothetical protein